MKARDGDLGASTARTGRAVWRSSVAMPCEPKPCEGQTCEPAYCVPVRPLIALSGLGRARDALARCIAAVGCAIGSIIGVTAGAGCLFAPAAHAQPDAPAPANTKDRTTRDLRQSPVPPHGEKLAVRDVDGLPPWHWRQPGMPSTLLATPEGLALLAEQGTAYARQVRSTCDLRTRPVMRMAGSIETDALALAGEFAAARDAQALYSSRAQGFDRDDVIEQVVLMNVLDYLIESPANGEEQRRAQLVEHLTADLSVWLRVEERTGIVSGLKRENENDDMRMTKPEQLGWFLESARAWSLLSLRSLAELNADWHVDFLTPNMSPREARQMLAIASTQQLFLPLREEILAAGAKALASINDTGIRPACWDDRMVTLDASDVRETVIVAVWDTGVDPAIFPGQMYENPGESGDRSTNGIDDDNDGYIDNLHGLAFEHQGHSPKPIIDMTDYRRFVMRESGRTRFPAGIQPMLHGIRGHGTCGASLIAAGNPAVRLFNLRSTFFNEGGMAGVVEDAWIPTIESVITQMRDRGVRIVNMSWGGASEELEAALERGIAASPNVLFVVSAGNSARDTGDERRVLGDKRYDNVILVGALDPKCEPTDFTSYGEFVNLFAWGRRVPATTIGGLPDFFGGTSAAAPIVSGLAAKLLAIDPSLTPTQLRDIMMETGTDLPSHPGCKILHMRNAVQTLRSRR